MAAYAYPKVTREGWTGLASKVRHSNFIITGLVGFISLLCIFLFSLRPLRSAAYEAFKRIHTILAITFTAAVMAHCTTSNRSLQLAFVIIAAAVFCVERLTRYICTYCRNHSRGASTWATVEAMSGQPQACRVTLEVPGHVKISPGMHAYLRFAKVRPCESHPFSIAWWEHSGSSDIIPFAAVSFIISAQTGFTRDLCDRAAAQRGGSFRTPASMEGPYAGHRSLNSYGHAVLFAGGTGITHQIAFVRHFLEGHETNRTATRRLVLVWAVRGTESIEWIRPWLDTINRMRERHRDILQMRFFVTGSACIARHAGHGIGMEVQAGRPPVGLILEAEALEQIGAMCVSVCGPGQFADRVRAAVRAAQRSKQDIDFLEESFGW